MKILVIDDEVLITSSLKRALEKRGHTVAVANNGDQGIKAWQKMQPQLVVIDFIMPDMNADQVLTYFPERLGCKVILMSAYLGEKTVEKPPLLKIDLFIKKPFENIFEICDLIEKVVD
ncbi:MAG: response regulator [Bdellovibrionaceae bacterium]|nr:response regulator [Pseudobdellovibrionaceae bacterium]